MASGRAEGGRRLDWHSLQVPTSAAIDPATGLCGAALDEASGGAVALPGSIRRKRNGVKRVQRLEIGTRCHDRRNASKSVRMTPNAP